MTEAWAALDDLGKDYGGDDGAAANKGSVKPIPWTDGVQTLTGMGNPNGQGNLLALGNPFYYTAGFVQDISPTLAAFLAKAQTDAPSKTSIHAGGAIVIMPLNGPFNNVPPKATAITARTAKFWVIVLLRLDGNELEQAQDFAWGHELKTGAGGTSSRINPSNPKPVILIN